MFQICAPRRFCRPIDRRGLSDLAAMGATLDTSYFPKLPALESGWVDHFASRFHQLCVRFGVDLIGGDTTKGPLSAHLTVSAMCLREGYWSRWT